MRPTLHDYVIEQQNRGLFVNENVSDKLYLCYNFANLTNRAPRLGDFIPCDEDGNVLEKPYSLSYYSDICGYQHGQNKIAQYKAALDRVIFKGDWEVEEVGEHYIFLKSKGIILQWKISVQKFINERGQPINRIEDLPREIEFKEGVV